MSENVVNILSTAAGPGALLSNFARTPFILDGVACASVEGFIQGIKEQSVEKRRRICLRHGFEAKRASTRKRKRKVRQTGAVWWLSSPIIFQSEEYYALIERALRAKVEQNESVRQALRLTARRELIHDTGTEEGPGTSLPKERFLAMLTKIRGEAQET